MSICPMSPQPALGTPASQSHMDRAWIGLRLVASCRDRPKSRQEIFQTSTHAP